MMIHKGQIVEIPADSPIYTSPMPSFDSLKSELIWQSNQIKYSLFDGFIVEGHFGLDNFVLGQRKGLGVSGKKEPLYVIGKDKENNRLFVGQGKYHPALKRDFLKFSTQRIKFNSAITIQDLEEALYNTGLAVTFLPHEYPEKRPAIVLIIGDTIFLKLPRPVSIAIEDKPIVVYYKKNILLEII